MNKKQKKQLLAKWQERLALAKQEHDRLYGEAADRREQIYRGERTKIDPVIEDDGVARTGHVRNIAMELIESMVSTTVPIPKVRARRKEDEGRARLIEDMLRAELDRMNTEELIDLAERTVPIQGGCGWLVEWDPCSGTHAQKGDVCLSLLHPKLIYPQPGIYTDVADMEWLILAVPQTRGYLARRYGVELDAGDATEDPSLRGVGEESEKNEELCTQYIAYFKNENGGIGLFSWVGDTVLQALEEYQAPLSKRCEKCGAIQNAAILPLQTKTMDGTYPQNAGEGQEQTQGRCQYCGCDALIDVEQEEELLYLPTERGFSMEMLCPGQTLSENKDGGLTPRVEPLHIPRYRPALFPVVLQKNPSAYGRLLGESDIDKIADQQNTTNRLSAKIIEKLLGAGSYLTLPNDATIKVDSGELKIIRLESPADKEMIGVHTTQGDISQDMSYLHQVYEEARQTLGITLTYQGQADSSAQSGKAKEIQAKQSAGRLQSKRVMKEAAFAKLFELIFKFKLAYTSGPCPVPCRDADGAQSFTVFNRYDFLERDEAGHFYWNDAFLFSCDQQSSLAEDRASMIEQTRQSYLCGSFGEPTEPSVKLHFWRLMEALHYPSAAETVAFLQAQQQKQQAANDAPQTAELPLVSAEQGSMQTKQF